MEKEQLILTENEPYRPRWYFVSIAVFNLIVALFIVSAVLSGCDESSAKNDNTSSSSSSDTDTSGDDTSGDDTTGGDTSGGSTGVAIAESFDLNGLPFVEDNTDVFVSAGDYDSQITISMMALSVGINIGLIVPGLSTGTYNVSEGASITYTDETGNMYFALSSSPASSGNVTIDEWGLVASPVSGFFNGTVCDFLENCVLIEGSFLALRDF